MEKSKLMMPLFDNGNFNRKGRKMHAIFEREITDGTTVYRLWRSAGKPDLNYPRAENDKYLLHVEVNGYLAPIRLTDYQLTDICGFELAAQKLYGGKEKRGAWIDALRESGGNDAVDAAMAEERKVIEQYGKAPIRQTAYIQSLLSGHVSTYRKARDTAGQTFPDFTGALVMNELTRCLELSAVYRAKQQAEAKTRQAYIEAGDKAYCEEQNRMAEQAVSSAIQVIQEDGVLENTTVTFYWSRNNFHVYSLVNYLMRQYQVNVPLRTQGWINANLRSVAIRHGVCGEYRYDCKRGSRSSNKFFEYMNALIRAVRARRRHETAYENCRLLFQTAANPYRCKT